MKNETTYTCDGCGKEARWQVVSQTWAEIILRASSFGGRIKAVEKHACSTACQRNVVRSLLGEQMTPEQEQAELEMLPDVKKAIDQLEGKHRDEIKTLRDQIDGLRRALADATAAAKGSALLTHDELRRLLREAGLGIRGDYS